MTIAAAVALLYGAPEIGPRIETGEPVRLLSPVRRSIGLHGDEITVSMPRSSWPRQDWHIGHAARYWIEVGIEGQTVLLGGYKLVSVDDASRGFSLGEGGEPGETPAAHEVILRLVTEPAVLAAGRGGVLREGTVNPVDRDGVVIDSDPAYMTMSELISRCFLRLRRAHELLPASLDTVRVPGPLDWGNAHPLQEMEALLSPVGHAVALANDATYSVVRLPAPGEAISVPAEHQDLAEPYTLHGAPASRSNRILVTSGRTRTTVVTTRDLTSLEFVRYDADADEWTTSGATGIAAFAAGPGTTPDEQAAHKRLYRAVRFGSGEIDEIGRLVTVSSPVEIAPGVTLGGAPATVLAKIAVPLGSSQFRNEPVNLASPPVQLDGVRVHPREGVIELPSAAVLMDPGPEGGYASASELTGDQLSVVFAHESNTGAYQDDYYAALFEVDSEGAVSQAAAEDIPAALDDEYVLVVEAPFLRHVMSEDGGVRTSLNGSTMDTIAAALASSRVGKEIAQSGSVPLRGVIDVNPGDWDGAVQAVEWDLSSMTTLVSVNAADRSDSELSALEAQSNRSYFAGLSRFTLPGTSAADADVRIGSSSAGVGGGSDIASPSDSHSRGRELVLGDRAGVSSPAHSNVQEQEHSTWLAKITSSLNLSPGRWLYTWQEVYAADDLTFPDLVGGRDSVSIGGALNTAESANDGSGVESNGVDRGNLPAGWEMQPCPAGIVVRMHGPYGGKCLFTYINADDGPCDSGGGLSLGQLPGGSSGAGISFSAQVMFSGAC